MVLPLKNARLTRNNGQGACDLGTLIKRTSVIAILAALAHSAPLAAQEPAQPISGLATDSPFQDPNMIYLEADEVVDSDAQSVITARGNVDARYQDRSLRADEIVYSLATGRIVARGNVILVDGTGNSQYADSIELSGQLESGVATDFTARLEGGGIASAAYAVRRSDDGVDLYNAYYTACEPCAAEDGSTKKPTWRLKARQVTQDKADQMIHYKDAVFEFKGIPLFYTPYLAHPDPSSERRSGLLMPWAGASGKYGAFYEQPYYWSISDYSELTVTPRLMQRVAPLGMVNYQKNFYSGQLEIDGSFTYDDWFDDDGDNFAEDDFFRDPEESLEGTKLRSHIFARGQFNLNKDWMWGFGLENATDDLYLDRYDIDEPTDDFGLYSSDSRRLVEQLYLVGQDNDYRYSASTYGFQSLRTTVTRNSADENEILVSREQDGTLPTLLPKVELDHYFTDPLLGGRAHAFGDATMLTRAIGDDYARFTAGAEWSKSYIVPGGAQIKPFLMGRADSYRLNADDDTVEDREFSRTLGQVGMDARWTFIRPGAAVDLTLEPRVQVTQSFGSGQAESFAYLDANDTTQNAYEDGLGLDLDRALFWDTEKNAGYDLWQEGLRVDVGGTFGADWENGNASVFLGQSYASDYEDIYTDSSGLSGDSSDLIGQFDVNLFSKLTSTTRLRYDDENSLMRRVDSSLRYRGERLNILARYYLVDETSDISTDLEDLPPEEISGNISYRFMDNWTARYKGFRDIDLGETRREELAFIYDDDCTLIELYYERNRRDGIGGDDKGFGIRIALLTLGQVREDN